MPDVFLDITYDVNTPSTRLHLRLPPHNPIVHEQTGRVSLHASGSPGSARSCSGARTVSGKAFAMLVLPKTQGFAVNG
jgi:hypothetical protein